MTLKLQSTSYFLSALLFTQSIQAINTDNFTTLENDRFANNGTQFIANGYDLSGVAITDNGKWVTMISDRVFLTSEHFKPAVNESVTFYASNDPTGTTETRSVAGSQRIGQSDLQIGFLDSPLNSSFASYSFATENIMNSMGFANSDYTFKENTFLFGRSSSDFEDTSSISQDIAVGKNKIDLFFGSATAENTTDMAIAAVKNLSTDANYVNFESLLDTGDSGAPLMVDDGSGNLILIGINWFVEENVFVEEESALRSISGFTSVGNYDIQKYINTVPEPATYGVLLGLTSFLVLAVARRRKDS